MNNKKQHPQLQMKDHRRYLTTRKTLTRGRTDHFSNILTIHDFLPSSYLFRSAFHSQCSNWFSQLPIQSTASTSKLVTVWSWTLTRDFDHRTWLSQWKMSEECQIIGQRSFPYCPDKQLRWLYCSTRPPRWCVINELTHSYTTAWGKQTRISDSVTKNSIDNGP